MTQGNTTTRSLRGDFKGVSISRTADGTLTVDVSDLGDVDVTVVTSGHGQITKHAPVEEQDNVHTVTKEAYNIGDVLPDGWVVMGLSKDTGMPFSCEPEEGVLDGYQAWHTGEDHAVKLRDAGNQNARQPTDKELNTIWEDVVKAGRNDNAKLNTNGSRPYGKYWSSTPDPNNSDDARIQYLGDGSRLWDYKDGRHARVRVVRDEPGLKLA